MTHRTKLSSILRAQSTSKILAPPGVRRATPDIPKAREDTATTKIMPGKINKSIGIRPGEHSMMADSIKISRDTQIILVITLSTRSPITGTLEVQVLATKINNILRNNIETIFNNQNDTYKM
jgi:hypothetical protein